MGLQGLTFLNDPISTNIKQYLYNQLIFMEDLNYLYQSQNTENATVLDPSKLITNENDIAIEPLDVIKAYRSLQLNFLKVPSWLEKRYRIIEANHVKQPVVPFNRQEKLVYQKYSVLHTDEKFTANSLIDGFRLDFNFHELKLNVELDGPSHRFVVFLLNKNCYYDVSLYI